MGGLLAVGTDVVSAPEADAQVITTTTSSWSSSLNCTGWVSVTVPTNTQSVSFSVWGGGGGDGDGSNGGPGGRGGLVSGTLNGLSAGNKLWAKVGCGGTDGGGVSNGWAGGGAAPGPEAGGGGAATALCVGSSNDCAGGSVLAIAGGGGGGGRETCNIFCANRWYGGEGGTGNDGGSSSRNQGTAQAGGNGVQGQNSGGAGGVGSSVNAPPNAVDAPVLSPSYGAGGSGGSGSGNADGGGGGGGLIGGGGGGAGEDACCTYRAGGGGGAGSSWVRTSGAVTVSPTALSGSNAGGNSACSSLNSTVTGTNPGDGGTGDTGGCAGYVQVTWTVNSTGTAFTTAPSSTGTAGVALATQPQVRATNPDLGGVSGESINLTYSGTSSGTLACGPVATNATGYAVFSGCSFPNAGTYTITATNGTTSQTAVTGTITIASNNNWSGYTPTLTQTCGVDNNFILPATATSATMVTRGAGGGGGGGGANSATGGTGAAGSTASLTNFSLPNVGTYPRLNYQVGCAGTFGQSNDSGTTSNAPGGTGGVGWGNGGNGPTVSGGTNRHSSGGGGGGGTGACVGTSGQTCANGVPILVAGGGGGGGGSSWSNSTRPDGGAQADGTSLSASWYGSGASGTSRGGSGGNRGNDSGGGGGGGGTGSAGQTGNGEAGGAGGGLNAAGTGGTGYNGGTRNGVSGSGSASVGGNGGSGGGADQDTRRTSGGGGGGGYYGGGGGGGDYGSGSPGASGGGSGSSWGNSSLVATPTFAKTGGGNGGAGGGSDANGATGGAGSISLTLAGTAINLSGPTNQSNVVGTAGLSLATSPVFNNLGGNLSTPVYSATGLPAGMSINSSTGTITGTAPTTVGVYSITVTGSTTTSASISPPSTTLSTSVSFSWTFTPAAAAKVAFSTQPGGGVYNTVWATQPVVQVQDTYGNVRTDSTASVTLSIGTGSANGTLSCTTNPKNAAGGVASFAGCKINGTIRSYTLVATASGLTQATSSSFAITRGANRDPVTTNVGSVSGAVGTTIRVYVPVSDGDGYVANSTGDETTPTLTINSPALASVGTCSFSATAAPASSGFFACNVAISGSAVFGDTWSFSYQANDQNGGTSTNATASGPVSRRGVPVGSVSCRTAANGGGSPVTSPDTGVPSWCSLSYTDPGVAVDPTPTVNGDVVADAKQVPSVGVSVALGSNLAGSDWFVGDGSLSSGSSGSGSCVLTTTGTGVSGCATPYPVVFRTAGSATLASPSGLAQTGVFAASSAASGVLTPVTSCTKRVYDGATTASPTGTYNNNGQWNFYAYNQRCGVADADEWGYAYGIGTPDPTFDPPYENESEAYLTDQIGTVGADGFGEWHPEVATDPGTNIELRFWGKTTAQSPSFYVSAAELTTQVQWLSGDYVIDIDGARGDGPLAPQTITFPSFTYVRDTTVTLAATASSGLAVSYAVTGAGCTLANGNEVTFSSTQGLSCKVTASQGGNPSWAAAPNVSRTVKVTKTPQTITFNYPGGSFYVDDEVVLTDTQVFITGSPLPVTMTATGGCTLDQASLPVTVTFTSTTKCTVTAAQAGDSDYAKASSRTWSPTPKKVPQTVTFNYPVGSLQHPSGPIRIDDTVELTSVDVYASPSSGPMTMSATGGCTLDQATLPVTVTFTSTTTCKVTATQVGDGTYAAASKTWSKAASKKLQSIDFVQPASPRNVATDVDLSGVTANPSGLTVTFTITSGPCTFADPVTVTASGPGVCKIKAAQPGDATWNAATAITRNVTYVA